MMEILSRFDDNLDFAIETEEHFNEGVRFSSFAGLSMFIRKELTATETKIVIEIKEIENES